MVIYVKDNISGMKYFYTNVKNIIFGTSFNTVIFKDGYRINFHNMIYNIEIY